MSAPTVRFSEVVKVAGQPEPYTLWQAPEENGAFGKALREHRVMTIRGGAGSQTDYGEIGYTKDRTSQLLLFPKSLKAFEGKRVVGIKYDLLGSAPDKKQPEAQAPRKPRKEAPSSSPTPAPVAEEKRTPTAVEPKKMIQFPNSPRSAPPKPAPPTQRQDRSKPDDAITVMKKGIQEALNALSQDRSVTVYKILEKLLKDPEPRGKTKNS